MTTHEKRAVLTLVVDMCFAPEARDQAISVLTSGTGRTEAKRGCMECMVSQDALVEEHVRYSEKWESESFFRRHVRSEDFRRVLLAMDMCSQEPRVAVGSVTGQEGLAQLEKWLKETPGEEAYE